MAHSEAPAPLVVRVLTGVALGLLVVLLWQDQGVLWPSTTRGLSPGASEWKEAHALELELFALQHRQQIVDRELLALGTRLSETNETWLKAAAAAVVSERNSLRRRDEAPPVAPPAALSPSSISPSASSSAPWGAGAPPDAYFLEKRECGVPRYPESFHVYERPKSEACARAQESWRIEPNCPGADGKAATAGRFRRQVLVTGVQRSGSHFTWEMFNRLGVHVHHEGLGPAGAVSWLYSWRAQNFVINNPTPITRDHRFCVVLHQVRHPLRVVSSIVKATKPRDKFWDWIYSVEPGVTPSAPPSLRAAQLWILQNERIEKYADARYRAEETSPRDVCRAAGFDEFLCAADGRYHTTTSKVIQPIVEPKQIPVDQVRNVRDYRPPSVSWADLDRLDARLTARVKTIAQRYGYNIDPRYHPQGLATSEFKA